MKTKAKNLILLAIVSVGFTACGSSENTTSKTIHQPNNNQAEGTTKKYIDFLQDSYASSITFKWKRSKKVLAYNTYSQLEIFTGNKKYVLATTNNNIPIKIKCQKDYSSSEKIIYSCKANNVTYKKQLVLFDSKTNNIQERGGVSNKSETYKLGSLSYKQASSNFMFTAL